MNALRPRRSHWGTGIALVFLLFCAGIFLLVYSAATSSVDLVADDYYERGIDYEKRIGAIERAREGGAPKVKSLGDAVEVEFRSPLKAGTVGTIVLYRPADRRMDLSVPLSLDSLATQRITSSRLSPGLWRVQISWSSSGQEYYAETPLVLP